METFGRDALLLVSIISICFIYRRRSGTKNNPAFWICLILYAVASLIGSLFIYFISGYSLRDTFIMIYCMIAGGDTFTRIRNRDDVA